MSDTLVKIVSTFFYIGYLPFMPGTFASIFALAVFYFIRGNAFINLALALAVISLGFLSSGKAEKIFKSKDPSCVVIDEAAGMFLALLFLPPKLSIMILALVLFRILDILKPYPIKKIQNLRGSSGIMGDDLLAGLCVNLVLQLALKVASLRIS